MGAARRHDCGEDERVTREDVDIICAGINHQTWYVQVQWRGMDMLPRMLEMFEAHPVYRDEEKVRIDVLRRFGYYSTESNGHLSEYVPWYRKRPAEINDWISLNRWILGRDGRVLARLHRGTELVRDGLPQLAGGRAAAVQRG